MQTALGQNLREKGSCYIRCLTDAESYKGHSEASVYNHWQLSFGTEDPAEVGSQPAVLLGHGL